MFLGVAFWLAAVVHRAQHVAERRGIPRHLEADVEALLHAELLHHVVELFLRQPAFLQDEVIDAAACSSRKASKLIC